MDLKVPGSRATGECKLEKGNVVSTKIFKVRGHA